MNKRPRPIVQFRMLPLRLRNLMMQDRALFLILKRSSYCNN